MSYDREENIKLKSEAIAILTGLLIDKDQNLYVRYAAVKSIKKLIENNVDINTQVLLESATKLATFLVDVDENIEWEVLEALINMVRNDNNIASEIIGHLTKLPVVREVIVCAIGEIAFIHTYNLLNAEIISTTIAYLTMILIHNNLPNDAAEAIKNLAMQHVKLDNQIVSKAIVELTKMLLSKNSDTREIASEAIAKLNENQDIEQ